MTTLIEEQFEFNLWANTEIIKLCASLNEEQLRVEIPELPGPIRPTIAHIVRSEGTYLEDLGEKVPWSDEVDWEGLALDKLLEMAQHSGAALRNAAKNIAPNTRCEFVEDNEHHVFPAWVVFNQAINHGIEHRTQLRVLLTKLGVPHPGQSVWGYAEAAGALQINDVGQE